MDYQKTPTPNLVRHANGTYYLRARFGGEPVRESLRTRNYQTARDKLAIRMAELRETGQPVDAAPETLHQAIAAVGEQVKANMSLKARTRVSYAEQIGLLLKTAPDSELRRISDSSLRTWWKSCAENYAPQTANHLLMWLRRALVFARGCGAIGRDPSKGLKTMKIARTRLNLLTGEQFAALIAHIRKQRSRHDARQSADWLEFMTYSGLRPAELSALRWEDIDTKRGVLTVYGGEEGTKNRKVRPVPIIPALADLLHRMRKGDAAGIVFATQRPRRALRNACRKLGFPHQRLYDLRHAFASACARSGVDVATFSKWLGHQDGGTLALKTYVHIGSKHEIQAAKKVRF